MSERPFYGWVVLAAVFEDAMGYQGLFLASFAIAVMAVVLGVTLRLPAVVVAPRSSPVLGG